MNDGKFSELAVQNQTRESSGEIQVNAATALELLDKTPTQLYRHFDSDGNLLYVGISISSLVRLGQHKDYSHWFKKIARVDIEHFESRGAAITAERRAIAKEKPLHNVAHKKDLGTEDALAYRARQSREALLESVVNVHVMYRSNQLPLPISSKKIKEFMDSGHLGYVELPLGRYGTRFVSGWQLLDFVEWLHTQNPIDRKS